MLKSLLAVSNDVYVSFLQKIIKHFAGNNLASGHSIVQIVKERVVSISLKYMEVELEFSPNAI